LNKRFKVDLYVIDSWAEQLKAGMKTRCDMKNRNNSEQILIIYIVEKEHTSLLWVRLPLDCGQCMVKGFG